LGGIHLGQTALPTTFRLGGWGYRGKDWPGLGDQSIPGVPRALAFLRDRLLEGVPELSYAHLVAPVVTPDVVAPVLTDSMAGETCSGWGLFYAGIAMFGEWPAPVLRRTSSDNNLLKQMVHNMGLLVAELVAPGALAGRDDVLTVPVLVSS
jgi:hypothetical protein